jgi:hypothetical protein
MAVRVGAYCRGGRSLYYAQPTGALILSPITHRLRGLFFPSIEVNGPCCRDGLRRHSAAEVGCRQWRAGKGLDPTGRYRPAANQVSNQPGSRWHQRSRAQNTARHQASSRFLPSILFVFVFPTPHEIPLHSTAFLHYSLPLYQYPLAVPDQLSSTCTYKARRPGRPQLRPSELETAVRNRPASTNGLSP